MRELLYEKGEYGAAEPIIAEGLTIGRSRLGEQNQDVALIRMKYGGCLLKLKRVKEAEKHLLAALPIVRGTLGERDQRTQKVFRFLVELYEASGRAGDAAKYRAFIYSTK